MSAPQRRSPVGGGHFAELLPSQGLQLSGKGSAETASLVSHVEKCAGG